MIALSHSPGLLGFVKISLYCTIGCTNLHFSRLRMFLPLPVMARVCTHAHAHICCMDVPVYMGGREDKGKI
jgi:hypothetical protein